MVCMGRSAAEVTVFLSLIVPGRDCRWAVKNDKTEFYRAADVVVRYSFVNSFCACV